MFSYLNKSVERTIFEMFSNNVEMNKTSHASAKMQNAYKNAVINFTIFPKYFKFYNQRDMVQHF